MKSVTNFHTADDEEAWPTLSISAQVNRAVLTLDRAMGGAAAFVFLDELATGGAPPVDPMLAMMGGAPEVNIKAPITAQVRWLVCVMARPPPDRALCMC